LDEKVVEKEQVEDELKSLHLPETHLAKLGDEVY
jgi:hypothetical protein